MTSEFIVRAVHAANQAILAQEAELEALDRNIGDGDHVVNLKRGFCAIAELREELAGLPPDRALQRIGMTLLAKVGGASGPLLASFFLAMATALEGREAASPVEVAAAFAAGVDAVRNRGKAELGEKTLLDVLIPVSRAFTRLAAAGAERAALLAELQRVAEEGLLSTRDLVATKGRAAFLGERAVGHLDPGAKTSQLIIHSVCDLAGQSAGEESPPPDRT